MANEITTTTADDLVFASWKMTANILPAFYGFFVAEGLVRYASLANLPTKAHDFPISPSLSASGLTEGTDMANTAFSTTKATVTAAEVGLRVEPTDVLDVSSIVDDSYYTMELGKAMAAKRTTDILALSTGFSTSVGTSGNNLTEAQTLEGITALMAAGVPGPYRGVLHPQQWYDLSAGIGGTLSPTLYGGAGARFESNDLAQPSADGGLGRLYGVDWVVTSRVPTANAGADRAGMIVAPDYAIGLADKWPVRVELERNASLRSTEINVTAMYGVGELLDAAGVGVVTDA